MHSFLTIELMRAIGQIPEVTLTKACKFFNLKISVHNFNELGGEDK